MKNIANWSNTVENLTDGAKFKMAYGSERKLPPARRGNSPQNEANFTLIRTSLRENLVNIQQGFTLIEVLVSSAILVILAVGLLGIQYIIGQNQVSVWRNYISIESANIALSTMSKEIRDARPSEDGSYPLEVADDQEIVFYADYDYDGVVERIRYTLSGTDLIKGIIEPQGEPLTYSVGDEVTRVISDIVRNTASPIFYYYNSEWPADTTNNPLVSSNRISETRQVKINLVTNPYINNSDDYVLESDVRIRMVNY